MRFFLHVHTFICSENLTCLCGSRKTLFVFCQYKVRSKVNRKSYSCSKMSENNAEICNILKFLYKKGKNATQATNEICEAYRGDAV